jgi:hypothetical protein
LVRFVTPEVKVFTSPSTLLEKPCTPVTTEAAKAAPGMLTDDFPPEERLGAAVFEALAVGWKPGS